jgi:glycosyltransferase involved in cell wall biosynthesis
MIDEGVAPHLLFVVNSDWFFLSHRLPIAIAAQRGGCRVTVAAIDTGCGGEIREKGLGFAPLPMTIRGMNPVQELAVIAGFVKIYRDLKPDLVHHVTVKPILYGSLAAQIVGDMKVVNAVSGLGYLFLGSRRAQLLRPLVRRMYRLALRRQHSLTIFQNPDDLIFFIRRGLVRPEQALLIRGSGVNCSVFKAHPEGEGPAVVVLPARLLWDKGVAEFVEAARLIRQKRADVRFVLVGDPDQSNPAAVPLPRLEGWVREGAVEWWGHSRDMPNVLRSASVVVLPSYREGLPKVLLEAAACGRAIVATDVPGCREIVRHGRNGFLVPVRNARALAEAIRLLLASPSLRQQFGRAGRLMAELEFAEDLVVERTLAVYRELLGTRRPVAPAQDQLAEQVRRCVA